MSRRFHIVLFILSIMGLGVVWASYSIRLAAEGRFADEVILAQQDAARLANEAVLFSEHVVPFGRTLSDVLFSAGADPVTVQTIIERARRVINLRRDFRAGQRLAIGRSPAGEFRALKYRLDADRELWIAPQNGDYRAEIKVIPSSVATVGVVGEIHDSLFNAVLAAGEQAELALQLADIFGWDLDFYTDPRPGDTFRLVVEKKRYADGTPGGYGRVLAAEYVNDGHSYQAVLFRDPSGREAYYAPDGSSLQKAFLRSPLKFSARISSRFSSRRFHPILRRFRPHYGIDYVAPVGSAVQAIGDGRVMFAGRKSGEGRMVHLRHANGYETMYLHLSSIAVTPGQRVVQGQVIGRVGSTGLSTAPHLDFRVLQHGRYRNFLTLRLPPAQPVARRDFELFATARDRSMALLPDPTAVARQPAGDGQPSQPASGDADGSGLNR